MKVATRKMRSPLKTHGGKSYLARRIVSLFPEHDTYVEPFFGGGSVLLNKPPCRREAANDLNGDLIGFWRVLRDLPDELRRVARRAKYTLDTFVRCREIPPSDLYLSPEERAARFLIVNRFSRGGMGKDFAWSDRTRGGKPGDMNAWETAVELLPDIARRMSGVVFHEVDAISIIQAYDSPTTLFYCDPPYLHATRTHRKAYDHEMADRDHKRLLEALLACKGRVFISGYPSPLYNRMLAGWKLHTFSMANHAGQGKVKQRRIECLWENPS